AQPVNALLQWKLQQLIDIKRVWLIYQTVDRDCPRLRNKPLRSVRNSTLRRVELVEVVVIRDRFQRRQLIFNSKPFLDRFLRGRFSDFLEFVALDAGRGRWIQSPVNECRGRSGSRHDRGLNESSAVQINVFIRDLV